MRRDAVALRFTELLLVLLKGKTSLLDSLCVLAREGVERAVREAAVMILASMKKGRFFSECLRYANGGGNFFAPLYITLVVAAEAAGSLESVLERIVGDLRRRQAAKEAAINVLIYPAIIVFLAIVGTIAIVVKVMPLFISEGFLSGSAASDAKAGIGVAALVLLSGGAALFIVYFRIFYEDSPEYRIFYLLDFLLQSNVTLIEALTHCAVGTRGSKFQKALLSIKKDIASGVPFSTAFAKTRSFSPYVQGWLSVADTHGTLGEISGGIRDYFGRKDGKLREAAAKLIEPAVIVLTGIYVLIIIITVILPILTFTGGLL